jgi:hypothetical protein
MKNCITFIFIFVLSFVYSKNDSLPSPTIWRQSSLFPDSNNYNVFHCGPGGIYRSLSFSQNVFAKYDNHFIFSREQRDMPLIKNPSPIVDVQYILGDELEQNLSIYHNQSISKRSHYAISFLKRSHDGYYTNQATNNNFFQLNYLNQSLDSNYNILIGLKHHRIYQQQNGGLVEDSSFINPLDFSANRKILNINMQHSYSSNKLWRAFIKQQWITKSRTDSASNSNIEKLSFNSSIEKKSRTYFDSLNADLFLNSFKNSFSSNDTLLLDILSNSLNYCFTSNKDSVFSTFSFGWSSELISQKNHLIDTLITNQSAELNYSKINQKSILKVYGDFFLFGYKKNNYAINLFFKRQILNNKAFNFSAKIKKYKPVFEISTFQSNHHLWENNQFKDVLFWNLIGNLSSGNLNFKTEYHSVSHPIYFKKFDVPQQFDSVAQVVKTSISHNISNKRVSIFSEIIYQFQGGPKIFQLPNWIGQFKINYVLVNKKSNLRFEVGCNIRAFSSYYLPSYLPELNQFAISNDFFQQNYGTLDILLKTTIKDVTVFGMVTHLNGGLMGYNYFSSLHYPSPDRYIKFGLKWSFLN